MIDKTPNLVAALSAFEALEGLPAAALQWIIDKSNYVVYEKGENLFYPDMAVNHMQLIMEGRYVVQISRGGKLREAGVWSKGYITGILPFSRMKEAKAYGTALEDTYVLELHKDHFTEMVSVSYELVQQLVGVMSTRIREFSQLRFQDEKLMALGKMSAGLAHELNNPASAMVRSAEELYNKIHQSPEKFKSVITMKITPEETDRVNAILFDKIQQPVGQDLSLLEREDLSDDIIDWLEDHDIENGEDIAETFIDFGLGVEELDRIAAIIKPEALGAITWWLESTMSLERLVKEIQESADRISSLVTSVKNYSHMDRSATKEPTDVREGIKNTLTIMKHRLKKKNINVIKSCSLDLPMVFAYGGQLNQVWTNVIDNAIDAMDNNGELRIDIYPERQYVCVDIADNGSGIPEEHLTRVFEPFFTTKAVGEGTGMGLEIVKRIVDRHDGEVTVSSSETGTTFKFCFQAVQ